MATNEAKYTLTYLTPRQKECLKLTAEGMTARAIAQVLGISVRMVRWHLQQARAHLGATSIAQAVYKADRMDLLD